MALGYKESKDWNFLKVMEILASIRNTFQMPTR